MGRRLEQAAPAMNIFQILAETKKLTRTRYGEMTGRISQLIKDNPMLMAQSPDSDASQSERWEIAHAKAAQMAISLSTTPEEIQDYQRYMIVWAAMVDNPQWTLDNLVSPSTGS
jgi:hypothetical protein